MPYARESVCHEPGQQPQDLLLWIYTRSTVVQQSRLWLDGYGLSGSVPVQVFRPTVDQPGAAAGVGALLDSPASSAVYRSLQNILCLESSLGA